MTQRFPSKFVLLELGDRWAVTVLSSVVRGVWVGSIAPGHSLPLLAQSPGYFYFFGTVKKRTERQISAQNTGSSGPRCEELGEMATGIICFGAFGGTEFLPMSGLQPGGLVQSWARAPRNTKRSMPELLRESKTIPFPILCSVVVTCHRKRHG